MNQKALPHALHDHAADLIVLGGGLSGCWAALTAARSGAKVSLFEKGYCGTSGVAAPAGPGHWWVPPLPGAREDAVAARLSKAKGLGDGQWMHRIIERTWQSLPDIGRYYAYEPDDDNRIRLNALRGPEYLNALRRYCLAMGVTIFDHSPVLSLLRDTTGRVAGAFGAHLQGSQGLYRARASAVILASGGCAFQSRLLGAANNTGDGHLMAAELGARLSGMEFSSIFSVVPKNTTMSRSMIYSFARYFDTHGREIAPNAQGQASLGLAEALAAGPVYCDLSRVPQDIREQLPLISPNVMLPFRRQGIDPFKDRFEIDLVGEGTIRGVGGIKLAGPNCESGLEGLFVTGDIASREAVTGPISGGGAVNAAWALASGCLAAEAALSTDRRTPRRLDLPGRAKPKTSAAFSSESHRAIRTGVQREMLDASRQLSRRASHLKRSLTTLDTLWSQSAPSPADASLHDLKRDRETQAMLAVARWCTSSALERTESLGMHRRVDEPELKEPVKPYHVLSGGLNEVRSWREEVPS